MRYLTTILFFFAFLYPLKSQDVETLFANVYRQLSVFPQEKVYLMTDKAAYVAGEHIWFRAFLTDAITHREDIPHSRYVYVDLISPDGDILKHHQISPDSSDVFHNRIELDNDLAEGSYLIRAYTTYMKAKPDYLFEKKVYIAQPQSLTMAVEPQFTIARDRNVSVQFRFRNLIDSSFLTVDSVRIKTRGSELRAYPARRTISLRTDPQRDKYLYLSLIHNNKKFAKYIPIPYPSDAPFDVSFFPEGGYMIEGEPCKVGFKSLGSNGLSEEITGRIYDSEDKLVAEIQSRHAGMGSFRMIPEWGKHYYALCTNGDGTELRFYLPPVCTDICAIRVEERGGQYLITVNDRRPTEERDLFLLIHIRGTILYAAPMPERNVVILPSASLPSGIIQILLLDKGMNPLSERLVFNRPSDFARVEVTTDRDEFERRTPVKVEMALELPTEYARSASFAVSVTDDRYTLPDTTMTIASYLLLSSELRGNIEDAGFYLSNHPAAVGALDALMLTQGWRRYDMPLVAKGMVEEPDERYLAMEQVLSGTVKGLLSNSPAPDANVYILPSGIDYFDEVMTNQSGRFRATGLHFPDSTRVTLYAGLASDRRLELTMDDPSPLMAAKAVMTPLQARDNRFDQFLTNAVEVRAIEDGIRSYDIQAAVVTASKPEDEGRSVYSSSIANRGVPQRLIDAHKTDLLTMLRVYPLVNVRFNPAQGWMAYSVRNSLPLLIVVDNVVWQDDDGIDLSSFMGLPLKRVEILGEPESYIFGSRLGTGEGQRTGDAFSIGRGGLEVRDVLLITTEVFESQKQSTTLPHIKEVMPLGYKRAVEFYAPKYETIAQRSNSTPDLRTTIYWKPDVQLTEEGTATIEFYTADTHSTYTLLMEGITSEGVIIR
ncbi:MAG: hypothetical protein FWD56_01440, partial [Bacteroidales bacterium]|nr:hypothetical protein [Bacteroidales bacterium]